jgi:hypothetical protein
VLVIAAYYLANIWVDVENYQVWWLAAVGLSWSFHITFTINMLSQHQPDIQEHGRIFSYTVIYIMNVLVIGIWMVLIGAPRFISFGDLLGNETSKAYILSYHQLAKAWLFCAQLIKSHI